MFKRLSRSRIHVALAFAICVPLMFMSHSAHAQSIGTNFCEGPACAGAHATFVFGGFTDIQVVLEPDGFLFLADLNGNPLPANYCDTTPLTPGSNTANLTPCTSGGVSGFIPQVSVILPAGQVLTEVGINPLTGGYALFLTCSNVMLPGHTYVITNPLTDPNVYYGPGTGCVS